MLLPSRGSTAVRHSGLDAGPCQKGWAMETNKDLHAPEGKLNGCNLDPHLDHPRTLSIFSLLYQPAVIVLVLFRLMDSITSSFCLNMARSPPQETIMFTSNFLPGPPCFHCSTTCWLTSHRPVLAFGVQSLLRQASQRARSFFSCGHVRRSKQAYVT